MIEFENKIINADCMDILKQLPDESVDLVLTDPPYRVISGGKSDQYKNSIFKNNDGKIFKENDVNHEKWISEVFRVLKDGGEFYCMSNSLNLFDLKAICDKAGFRFHNLLVWEKNNSTPNRWYLKNCEYTLYFYKGKAKAINNKKSKTVHKFQNTIDRIHPTEKPEELMRFYISNSSKEGDLILDCFSGSGTTAIACHNLKRRFICIEKDKDYYEASVKRLEAAQKQLRLF